MSKFPNPVPYPENVEDARKSRKRALQKSLMYGITARLAIVVLETGAFFLFGSRALFMDALSTLLDISSSLILFLFIRLAYKPPDLNHPFGHGRLEPLAGLQLGIFLAMVGFYMGFQNLYDIRAEGEGTLPLFLFIVPMFAIILLEVSYRQLMRMAKKESSSALVAEAAHFRIDALTSVLAMLSLIVGQLMPGEMLFLDKVGAILIAVVMVFMGISAALQNMHQLLDKIPDEEFFTRVKLAALRAEGVRGTEKIRIQQYGPNAHVDIDVEVDPGLTVEEAHRISQQVRFEIQKDWPNVQDVIVHIEPYYAGDH